MHDNIYEQAEAIRFSPYDAQAVGKVTTSSIGVSRCFAVMAGGKFHPFLFYTNEER
jgi:hypothetical protein